MDQLRVDTDALRETGFGLRRVAEEFADANANSDHVADAIAHRGFAGATRSFAHNWDGRRQGMLGALATLAGATMATADGIDHVDAELGRALLGQPVGHVGPPAAAVPMMSLRAPTGAASSAQHRPTDWAPLAERDPLSGDPDVLSRGAEHYGQIAWTIEATVAKLRALAADTTMVSAAVSAIRAQMGEVADDIAKAQQRYTGVAAALRAYAPELENAQWSTGRARTKAHEAEDLFSRAATRVQAAQAALVPPAVDSPELRSALALQADGEQLMAEARRLFDDAVQDHEDAGARAERWVNEGKSGDGLGDSRWDDFKGAAIDFLKVVSKAADVVAMGAGFLALVTVWCPPLSAFFGSVATYATVLSLVSKLLLQSLGEDMWTDIALSVASLGALALGRVAIGAFRTSVAGAQGAARAAAGSAAATSPATRAAAGLPSHADSAAAIRAMMNSPAVTSRRAATEAAQRSLKEGFAPSRDEIVRSLRALPGETWDSLRAARNLDVQHPIRQLKTNATLNPLAMAGQPGAAAELSDFKRIDSLIRTSPTVERHEIQRLVQGVGFSGAVISGGGVFAVETFRFFMDDLTPAQRLNLAEAGR